MSSSVFNIDCMEYMKNIPDKYFSIAILDPPYGIGNSLAHENKEHKNSMWKFHDQYKKKQWDKIPDKIFFDEVFRVSKNQIVFGFNYFNLPPSRGVICWDKQVFIPTMSRCELIWTSFSFPAKIVSMRSANPDRFHVTQKPVKLYEWIISNFAKPGDTIFDPMIGSQSSRIAADLLGFDYVGCEIDKEYFDKGCEFYNKQIAQHRIIFN